MERLDQILTMTYMVMVRTDWLFQNFLFPLYAIDSRFQKAIRPSGLNFTKARE